MKIQYYCLLLVVILCAPFRSVHGQQLKMSVNLSGIDGIEITPDNIFNFQIINNEGRSRDLSVVGTVIYKNSGLRFSYRFSTIVHSGVNVFSKDKVISPQWNFSDNALRELFLQYKKLPQGTYEYCVEINLDKKQSEEMLPEPTGECIYQVVNDIFLINLITPENDAKIYEYNPMLSWMVNSPFASSLTYRLRLAEVKQNQNNENAVNRNNLIYKENNLLSTSQVYPVTAKPLQPLQPYAWTVDAYYKGLLLGGAEAWRFTIIEDSFLEASIPREIPFLDIRKEKQSDYVYAIGKAKIKYDLVDFKTDTLHLSLSSDGKEVKMKEPYVIATAGSNRFEIDLSGSPKLRHLKIYTLTIVNIRREKFVVSFRYVNPELL